MSTDRLSRSTPEAQGVDSRAILAFLDHVKQAHLELHSFMLWRNGHVIAEGWWKPYNSVRPHMLHSLTKSFTATGVGLALAEGRFALRDKVIGFFQDKRPLDVSDNLAAMEVRDLLMMTTGHESGISGGAWRGRNESWIELFLREPVVERPGQRFVYSSASSFMLSAILQRATGERLADYLKPRLLDPLGISTYSWDTGSDEVTSGGNGLSATTVDLVKFGILHLQGGMWDGRRILPESWIKEATAPIQQDVWMGTFDGNRVLVKDEGDPQSTGQRHAGYGYHWWIGANGAYYAWGIFGQYCIVLPGHNAVIAFTAALPGPDSALLDLVWRYLLPGIGKPIYAGSGTHAAFKKKLKNLQLLPPQTVSSSHLSAQISGARFDFPPNQDGIANVSFVFKSDRYVFTLVDERGTHTIEGGIGKWIEGITTMTGNYLHHQYQPDRLRVMASGVWPNASTFSMTWQFVETAFRDTVTCAFGGSSVEIERSVNVNTSATHRPPIRGSRSNGKLAASI